MAISPAGAPAIGGGEEIRPVSARASAASEPEVGGHRPHPLTGGCSDPGFPQETDRPDSTRAFSSFRYAEMPRAAALPISAADFQCRIAALKSPRSSSTCA